MIDEIEMTFRFDELPLTLGGVNVGVIAISGSTTCVVDVDGEVIVKAIVLDTEKNPVNLTVGYRNCWIPSATHQQQAHAIETLIEPMLMRIALTQTEVVAFINEAYGEPPINDAREYGTYDARSL